MADIGSDALGNLFSAGMGFATGNPLAAGAGIAGLGLSIFGGISKMDTSKQMADASMNIARTEQQQDDVRRKAMELSARRQQMEVLRNAQRARSLALNNATSQGAQFGSGLQGGFGQIQGTASWNNLGITQGLQAGEQMFDLNAQINTQKYRLASLGGTAATAQGMSSLGSSLMGAMPSLKNLGGRNSSSNAGNSGYVTGDTSYGGWANSMGGLP